MKIDEELKKEKKKTTIIVIIQSFLIIGLLFFGIYDHVNAENRNQQKCINIPENSTPLLISRVPIDNPIQENREYKFEGEWFKKCI